MKKTLDQKLNEIVIKRPSSLIYNPLILVARYIIAKSYGAKVTIDCDINQIKGPFILISNHASRADYAFNAAFIKHKFNIVVGYNEFFRGHLSPILKLLNVIPKKNFTPDYHAMKSINRIIKNNGCISIYPEGMSSISGANQPIALGTAKFLKHYKLPVYFSLIKGGYLSMPKYDCIDRPGHVESEIKLMFTKEDLEKYSESEIEDIINEKLYHDDYAWNKVHKYHYQTNNETARNLHTLLFWCPKCHKEFSMEGKGNVIRCLNCGNGAKLEDTYEMIPFDDSCVIPETQTRWFNMQREFVKEQVKDENFKLVEHVKLGMLPKYKMLKNNATSIIVGEGDLTLTRNGLDYVGTKDNQEYSFHIDSDELPTYGMCTDITRFYTFYKGEFVEFYPEHNTVEKWFLATEEIHRLNNGKWQDFKFDKDRKADENESI